MSADMGFSTRLHSTGPAVEEWEAKLAQYGTDYMSQGAALTQQRLAADLVVLQQQLDTPRMWAVAARLMTLFAKTYPGSDGNKAISWYRMAADAADRSEETDIRVWVRGRAAIALGYEGASLPVANAFADQPLGISERHSRRSWRCGRRRMRALNCLRSCRGSRLIWKCTGGSCWCGREIALRVCGWRVAR